MPAGPLLSQVQHGRCQGESIQFSSINVTFDVTLGIYLIPDIFAIDTDTIKNPAAAGLCPSLTQVGYTDNSLFPSADHADSLSPGCGQAINQYW